MSDRSTRRRQIAARREAITSDYAECWSRMIREWRASRRNDAVWLLYSASYLFNTRGLKWAVDPVLLSNRVPEAQVLDTSRDLSDLEFVLLTHAHVDHVDAVLWTQLRECNCHWVVPEHMADCFTRAVSVGDSLYTVATPGEEITLAGARIIPFDSPHYERLAGGEVCGVAATGYRVETAGRSYLFPGDVRTYDSACTEPFGSVSALFAHVFLGRAAAMDPNPPLLGAAVEFYLDSRPEKIILSHLYEFGRGPDDCWTTSHAETLARALTAASKDVTVLTPGWYQETVL